MGLLEDLAGEPMNLFKEKINYKLAGSGKYLFLTDTTNYITKMLCVGGFAPHIDAVAYTHIKNVKHLTILLSVDPSNLKNGGLEVVDASHGMDIPINETSHCIEANWVDDHKWTPVELEAG